MSRQSMLLVPITAVPVLMKEAPLPPTAEQEGPVTPLAPVAPELPAVPAVPVGPVGPTAP